MRSAFYNLINFINMTNVHDVYWGAAKKILQNIYQIPHSTITEVADMCYVSTATISRLCRKLNYESFADFKNDVTMNLNFFNQDAKRLYFDHQLPSRDTINEGKEIFKDHFQNIIHNLQDTYDNIQYEDLMKIVDKIHDSKHICFAGNFFTQSVSMQLQIELSYLGKDCIAMYPLEQQKEIYKSLDNQDLVIVTSIAGGFFQDHPDAMRALMKTPAYVIAITQLDEFPYSDKVDMILHVGNNHHSLIGKFSITYIFEVLEALYHLKYGTRK
ncbi:MurR/RpiR family transcriptional regulator [Candidatus Stoquefichus massiliensis]|uniref:MurR/RpiR family transcriptional regulator n=1 Tax=Candidatus Stoquefichus massiliensis TaxID=1470350 RepID=UPI000482AC92|nr:MurR/RpiR family transcriptional regulator [Candidatus Stoquefichus massiliensis]